jgi:serine/threonine protein kinase
MIGGYRVIRKVAAGGFGVVYLALDSEGQQGGRQGVPAIVAGHACAW